MVTLAEQIRRGLVRPMLRSEILLSPDDMIWIGCKKSRLYHVNARQTDPCDLRRLIASGQAVEFVEAGPLMQRFGWRPCPVCLPGALEPMSLEPRGGTRFGPAGLKPEEAEELLRAWGKCGDWRFIQRVCAGLGAVRLAKVLARLERDPVMKSRRELEAENV